MQSKTTQKGTLRCIVVRVMFLSTLGTATTVSAEPLGLAGESNPGLVLNLLGLLALVSLIMGMNASLAMKHRPQACSFAKAFATKTTVVVCSALVALWLALLGQNNASTMFAVAVLPLLLVVVWGGLTNRKFARELNRLKRAVEHGDVHQLEAPFAIREFEAIAHMALATQERMHCAEEKFMGAFQKNVAPMAISSRKDGRLLEVNEAFLETFRFSKHQVLGKTLLKLGVLEPEVRRQMMEKLVHEGDSGLTRAMLKDRLGNTLHGEIREQSFIQADEEFILTAIHDTTERIQAEELFVLLSRAIEDSPVSVVITDLQGRIEYVNPKYCEVMGYTASSSPTDRDRHLRSTGEKPEALSQEIMDAIARGREWRGELCNRREDGTFFWESAVVSGIRNAEGELTHYLSVKEDISERKQIQEQAFQVQRLQSAGQMATEIAHEINTPLQFISDNVTFIREALEDLVPLLDGHMELIGAAQKCGVDATLLKAQLHRYEQIDAEFLRDELPKAITESTQGVQRVAQVVRAMKDFSRQRIAEIPGEHSLEIERASERGTCFFPPPTNGRIRPNAA